MMQGKMITLGSAAVLASLLFLSGANAEELATVNGIAITDQSLSAAIPLNEGQKTALLKDPESKRQALVAAIDLEVLAQEGAKQKVDQEPGFKQELELVRKQALVARYLEKKLGPQVTQAAAKKFYQTHTSLFSTDRVHVLQILVPTEAEASNLIKLAKAPNSDFQGLAERHSKDPSAKNNRGDLGYIGRSGFDPAFTNAAFSAAEGEIVGPVKTSFGYHVLLVKDRLIGKTLEFSEVENLARTGLRQQLMQELVASLKSQAKIKIKE